MDEVCSDESDIEISIKPAFAPKFFKDLNYHLGQKIKKSLRKLKSQKIISEKKLQKFENVGISFQPKSSKKLQEVNRNGNRILAQWKDDQINGQAQIHYNNGVTFKGVYQKGIKIKGHFKFKNGYEYVGNCLGNQFNGQGSLFFPSGKIITGEWKDYNVVGKGKIEYPQGDVYYGQIENLKKNGEGYLYFKDGSKYIGQFSNGLINGKGTYLINDEIIYEGFWQKGQFIQQQNSKVNEASIQINNQNSQNSLNRKNIQIKSNKSKFNRKISSDNVNKKVHFAD